MFFSRNQSGIAIIISILTMSTLLLLSSYFLTLSLTEKKIAFNQNWGHQAYYLAESGLNEMVWRLQNDLDYVHNFESNPNWAVSFTRNDPFVSGNGYYEVDLVNTGLARGFITAIGAMNSPTGQTIKRVIKASVYKAIGEGNNLTASTTVHTDNDFDILHAQVNIHNGGAQVNGSFKATGLSQVDIDNSLNVVGTITKSSSIIFNAYEEISNSTEIINLPAIDFDSDDQNSYKNSADVIYSENEFENLIKNNQVLTLNDPITYVSGDVRLDKNNQTLVVNGLLVVEGNFDCQRGINSLIINESEGEASGIFVKGDIDFRNQCGTVLVKGIIYTPKDIKILSHSSKMDIYGAIMARKIMAVSVNQPIDIYYDEGIVNATLKSFNISPLLAIEHWEELY